MKRVDWVRRDRGVADEIAGRKAFHDGCRFRVGAPTSWKRGFMEARSLASRDAQRGRLGDASNRGDRRGSGDASGS